MKNGAVRFLVALAATAVLAGCASTREMYYGSIDSANARAVEIADTRAQAEIARINALVQIAQNGSETSRVAAAMALAFSGQNAAGVPRPIAPQIPQNEALQWAQVLVPAATALAGGYFSYRQATTTAGYSRDVAISTNESFVTMGRTIGDTGVTLGQAISDTAVSAYPFMGDTYGAGSVFVDNTGASFSFPADEPVEPVEPVEP
jgi:hypothetical protein